MQRSLDVGTGGERLLIAGQHHRADRLVGFEFVERGGERLREGIGQGVEDLRPVQGNQTDTPATLDQHGGLARHFGIDRFDCLHVPRLPVKNGRDALAPRAHDQRICLAWNINSSRN
jgi:hypothetical protein